MTSGSTPWRGACRATAITVLSLCAIGPVQAQSGAHVHGQAALTLALEGTTLELGLEAPLDVFTGFEHPPRDAGERRRLEDALASLKRPSSIFAIAPAGVCDTVRVEVSDPFGKHGHEDEHEHEDRHEHEAGHAEVLATWQFSCAEPASLDHIDVKLFKAFPRLERIDAVMVGQRGQSASRLLPGKARLDLR